MSLNDGEVMESRGADLELWLFTLSYPYGNGEPFLETELPIIARRFERVRIFPLLPKGNKRELPANATVERVFGEEEVFKPMPLLHVFLELPRLWKLWRISRASAPSPAVFRKHRRELFSIVRQAFERERIWRQRIGRTYDPRKVILFSYWTSDWATILGLWKLREPRVGFVSRMMGYDLFDHRADDRWQRLQAFHVQQVDHIFTISKAGLEHMQERYPQRVDKFSISYLATLDHGSAPWAPASELRIVSCANVIPLKRVHLIAQALKYAKGPMSWTHFGDGEERPRIEACLKDLPPHVRVDLKGNCRNEEILAWYRTEQADVFVHTSETEGGVPVALQEAASFGIPLLAANAGGVPEIVTTVTGVLLPNALTSEMLAEALEGFRDATRWNSSARQGVRSFWARNFQAEVIHDRFCDRLITLHQDQLVP